MWEAAAGWQDEIPFNLMLLGKKVFGKVKAHDLVFHIVDLTGVGELNCLTLIALFDLNFSR